MAKLSLTLQDIYAYSAITGDLQIDARGGQGEYFLKVRNLHTNRTVVDKPYKTLPGIKRAIKRWQDAAERAKQIRAVNERVVKNHSS